MSSFAALDALLIATAAALHPVRPAYTSRRVFLAAGAACWPCGRADASGAAAAAARARAAERRQNEALASAPINQLREARAQLDVAAALLGVASDGGMTAAKWGDFREGLAPGLAGVRRVCPKKGAAGELRAGYLSAAGEVDAFAYAQQERNWRDKYPGGYAEFVARNQNIDVTAPTAALERAARALDALIAAAAEEEWGTAVSIEL